MRYIPYGLLASTLLGALSIHAMEKDSMDNQCVEWANEISRIANELPIIIENLFSIVQDHSLAMTAPERLKALEGKLNATALAMHAGVANKKIPVIEQVILDQATTLFEQEVNDLRPENPCQGGRDRNEIKKLLEQLFKNNSPQNWRQIQDKSVPYIPNLIDVMVATRNLNDRAQLTLKRAKQDSFFHEEGLAEKVIAVCVKAHLAGLAEPLRTQIADIIESQRGPRYYAIHAAYQWMHDQKEDSYVDQEEEDDNDDDNQKKDYAGVRLSKRMRVTKKWD